MVDCGHGAALFLRFHHHQRRGQRRNEPVALQKAIGANGAALGRVLADYAALLLDLFPQLPVGGRVGAVNRHAQHPDGGAVFLHCGPVPGAVQPIGQTADDDGPVLGQTAAQVCRRLQAVLGGPAAAHHSHSPRLIEPEGVAGAVEHQRHIGNAGKSQRVIRVVIGQDADIPRRTPPRKGPVMRRGVVGQVGPGKGRAAHRFAERIGIPVLPGLLRPAKHIQHPACMAAARSQRVCQPEPAEQRIGGRFGREKTGLAEAGPGHRLSSRKCHSRMLPAMPAFRLSTRSVMGMRTVPLQAAMVSSVRPWPSLPMTTQTPPG